MDRIIKIGTRGSKLALWQAEYVEKLLNQQGLSTQIVIIETKGDKILDRSLAKIGSKGVFTEELENQLHTGDIDIAVHSAKDMQATFPEGLQLIAFTEREKVSDVLVSYDKNFTLRNEASLTLGTSSVRRVAMLHHYYPNVKVVDVRGNLQTRMKKMEEGHCDALVLAFAGVHRMGYDEHIVHHFPSEQFIPPVGQGSVSIQSSSSLESEVKQSIREAVNHVDTEKRLLAERAFLRKLQGGCSIPAFALAHLEEEHLSITGGLISTDGKEVIKYQFSGKAEEADALGFQLAEAVLNNGGKEILEEIKKNRDQ